MKTTSPTVSEAYVIESDGSKTAVPIGFADEKPRTNRTAAYASPYGYAQTVGGQGFKAHPSYAGVSATAAPRRGLHLGRRLLGAMLVLIGLPLLILPGPGIALIGLGLLMVTMP